MKTIQMQIGISVDENAMATVTGIIQHILKTGFGIDEKRETSVRASKHALLGGGTLPEDKGCLIDSKQVAELLKVSQRTVIRLKDMGKMPAPIRVGRTVRWPYGEIRAWVNAGCPSRGE